MSRARCPDTLDGRFAVLATITALVLVRLEAAMAMRGNAVSVALTERFIEVMESEHRELGLGDPTLGKTVRKLVGIAGPADRAVALAAAGRRRLGRSDAAKPVQGRGSSTDAAATISAAALQGLLRASFGDVDSSELEQGEIAMTDRFAHQLRLDQIRDGERLDLVADEAERAAIARRLGLPSLDRLEAHVALGPDRRDRPCRGAARRSARPELRRHRRSGRGACRRAVRICCSCRSRRAAGPDEEIELGEQDCDVVFYDGATIDLGSAIADTLALSLDPYPRSAGAEAALKEAGVLTEEQASPFAVLAKLKKQDEALERNVVVEVGVERRRLRTRLGPRRRAAAAEIVAAEVLAECAAAAARALAAVEQHQLAAEAAAARSRSSSGRCPTGPSICGSGAGLRDRPCEPLRR